MSSAIGRIRLAGKRIGLVAAAVVLFVAAITTTAIAGDRFWSDRQAEQARGASVAAARHTLESILSYDFKTVDIELPKAAQNLTPSFRADYRKLIDTSIVPAAKEKQLTVIATTEAAGVISTERSHAVVLVYVNQVTTSKDSPQGTVLGSRVRVGLDKDDGHWLVARIDPV